jgi:hypothetical protein
MLAPSPAPSSTSSHGRGSPIGGGRRGPHRARRCHCDQQPRRRAAPVGTPERPFRSVPTSVETNRACLGAPDELDDGVAEWSPDPALERGHRAAAAVSELAFDEGSFARGQAAVGGAWMVGGAPPAGAKSETAQPADDCVIGALQERGEDGGVKAEQLVFVFGPARAGGRGLSLAGRCKPEPAPAAADTLGRSAQQPGGVIDRAQREDAAQAGVVLGRPPAPVGGEAEPSGACRDRRGRPLRQLRGHLVAAEAAGVSVADDRVL